MIRLKFKSVKYILFLIATLLAVANSAFALEQLKNYDFTSALANDNWQTNRRISGGYNSTVDILNNNLRIYGYSTGNNRDYDGMAYQTFRTPATAINARFEWGEWSATGGSSNRNFWIGYSTSNQTNANVTGGAYLSQNTAVGNYSGGSLTVTNLTANTTYYAKLYAFARLGRYVTLTVLFDSLSVNFSPSGLAANLSTSNKNVNGTAFTFINGVNLTWNTSTSNAVTLSKYNVYRSTTSGSGYEKVGEVAAGTTSYLDKPENPGTYYYVITDVDTNGNESPYSKEVSITSPGQITGLTAEVITPWSPTNTFIRLGSNPSPGGAVIYFFRGTSSGNYDHYASWGGNTSVDDATDLVDDTIYYYTAAYVFSYGPERYSPTCEEISVYYLTPPLGLTAHYSYDFTNMQDRIVLSWDAKTVPNVQGYNIYRSTTENGTYSLIDTVNGSTTTFNDVLVEPGHTYYYKITCTTNKGSSGLSFPVSAYVSTPPTNLTANMQSATRVVLNWTAPNPTNTNHNGYYVYRALIASGPYTQIAQVWGNTVTYTDNSINIQDGDCFFYVVADFDYSNNLISGYSNVAKASKLFPPTNLTATENGTSITLNWTASPCPLAKLGGYYIYRGEYNEGPYELVGTVVGNTTSFVDTTAPYNANSYYVVTTYNINGGESDYSNEAECFHHAPVTITVTIDSSVAPEIVLSESNVADIPVNWTIDSILPGVTITNYTVTIYKSNGSSIQSGSTSNSSAETYTVNNVLLMNGQSYYAEVTVTYVVNGETHVETYHSTNNFTAITPATLEVIDGWSGKDIAYTFFDNRVEASWHHDGSSVVVRYEIAVGTTPYGTDLVDWHDIGLTNRIAITTPELASGTRYFTSVRGVTQKKNYAFIGCSDGFIARKDPVTKDTDALNFFNNARVLENLSTDNGKLTPSGEIFNGDYKYCMSVTVTEPGVTDRVNAPCLVNFDIPAAQRPANIREFRVVDDQGNVVPRYNLTTPNNSTVAHPYIVFLVNMRKSETRTYSIYWGYAGATEPAYGFVQITDKNSLNGWTPYYTRNDTPAGMEDVAYGTKQTYSNLDDGVNSITITDLSKFYFYGTNCRANTWYLAVNGYLSINNVNGYESYTNRFQKFTGSGGTILGKSIVPLWVDHMTGNAWSESGVFRTFQTNPNRLIFTWITYRFGVTDDAYKFQAVLYETGDIAIRYGLINPRALISNGSYDMAVNTSEHHTVGISNGDATHYLYHTPLLVGINQNPTAFYQCMNAFDDTTVYGSIIGDGTEYSVANFESMVFDTKIASPKWTCLQYDTTISGNRQIEISYRTGNTPLPDNSWTAWTGTTSVTSSITNGEIAITTSGRYIQYKAEFKKTATSGSMSLNEVRFIYGGISIQDVCSVVDGQPVTEVTQGQTNIPLTVTIKNESPEAVNLTVATLTFTLNGHSASLTDPSLPFSIGAGELATLTYSIDIADNATTGECTIDALATVSALIYDDSAQNPLTWIVKSKSGLVIDNVYSEYTKVTKGYSYNLFITLTNTGEADCMLNSLWPTYASGTYTFTFDPSYGLATGTYPGGGANTIIHGNETKTAKFIVAISSESTSGSDTLGAVASATNILSGETIEVLSTDNPHIWTIQTPAELNLYDIVASTTLYRGQKNNNIILFATNEGEAELEWYTGSSTQHINFTPITGPAKSYENKKMLTEEPVINITSDNIVKALYSIDIKQDTATGTDRITAQLFGKELNTGVPLDYTETLPYLEWTIYSERVNTFADGAYSEEKDSFNLPSGAETLTVYAKVENLAANVEYIVHWIAPDGTEIETTTPIITSGQGYFGCWIDFTSSSQSGLYKIRVTDPLNLYTCCENTFEVVSPAEMDASFTLPLYATINQPIIASFTFINLGGAVIANATLVSTESVKITGTVGEANVVFTPDDTDALFYPRLSDVPGYGQATTTFKLMATNVGNFTLIASATGFDNNSGVTLSLPDVESNICIIQNPPNIRITTIDKTSNTVYKNQKNLRVTATLVNEGEATAVITAASITFNIGTYEQELMGYPDSFELELASGQSKTITFDVSVDVESASGLDTLTINAVWYDKNWPREMISSGNTTWTIADCGIILSANPDFDYVQSDYVREQTVYVRAYGVAPNTQYYRIRFYNSQIAQANTVPSTGYMTTDQGYSGLLAANDDGYVEHIYKLPAAATIGTWSVTLENAASINSTYQNYGSMLALQYFRVQNTPHMTAVITAENTSIEKNDKIFVGDTFRVYMTLTSTTADNNTTPAINTGAIDFIEPYSLIKNPSSTGDVELVSGPDPATFTLRAGESKTFEYIYRATEYTGNGKFTFKSSDANYVAKGRNRNVWDHNDESPYDIFAHQILTSNEIDIYIKTMAVDPDTLHFGELSMYSEDYLNGLICGNSQEIDLNLVKTGNYDVENILLNASSLNGPIVNGLRKSISSTYFDVDVASFSNPLTRNSEKTKVSLTIPYNQPKGDYLSTMFLYSDANNNGVFDSGEVTAEFNVGVYVNECKVIKVNDKVVDMGGWVKNSTTGNFEVNYFNAGNLNFSKAKIVGVGSLTSYITFITPTDVGEIAVGEYKKATFKAIILDNAQPGTYIATYTIFEDNDENGAWNPSASPHNPEPYDTFQIHMTIGQMDFDITPTAITASPVETSFTAQTGVYPTGFSQLSITNNSTNGMPLTRIKMLADTFDGVDKNGAYYSMASNTVTVYPGSLKQPLESGENDIFEIEVYIAPGTRCATYTTTLHFFSDDNDNNLIDTGETNVNVTLKVYVKPTEKVKVIDKPVSVTGMSSDVQDTYAECEFLCYNLGNVDLKHLKFEMQNLVQKDVQTPVTIDKSRATFSFVGDDPFVAPLNSEFSSKVTIIVPQGTPDGVYITTVPCKIYNDNGGDPENELPESNGYDVGECYDEFQIWLQIGEMKLVILNPHNVHGEPSEHSSDGPFTVKNDGALTVTSVTATATNFIYNANVIPATASTFLTSPKVGTLKPGFQKSLNWIVDIPDCMPAGVYTGKISVWSDTDGNGEVGAAEASATADVTVTVDPAAKLSIRENSDNSIDIDETFTPFVMNNSTATHSVRLYNTGNMPITNPIQVIKNDLTFMTNSISTSNYSILIDSTLPIQPGEFRLATITVTIGDEHLVNGHYRGELTFYSGDPLAPDCSDKVILDVEFGKKELQLSPNPLIFDNLPSETEKTVTATRVPPASLKKICVYEKSACDCGQTYCDQTTIEVLTPGPVNIETSRDFVFKINVGPNTPAGPHIATWTFFDDSNGDLLFNEGEYYVDLQIQYIIPDNISATITPVADYNILNIAPGETQQYIYWVNNNGNTAIDCSDLLWNTPYGNILENENGTPYMGNFSVTSAPTGTIEVNASASFVVTLTAPDDQELGVYQSGSPLTHTLTHLGIGRDLASTLSYKIEVVRRGPIAPNGTVYQVVATDTFEPDFAMPSEDRPYYFVSAWVCPGKPDPANNSYANLSVIRCDEAGKPKAALSINIGNNNPTVRRNNEPGDASYSVFLNTNDGEFYNIGPTNEFHFWPDNDSPYYGISGDPVVAIDNTDPANPQYLTFYRIYFAFKIENQIATDSMGLPIEPEHQDKIAIFLTQSTGISNNAETAVYFDGVKLEKSLWKDQDRPTTYHKDSTLVSPSNNLDVSGKHKHYEW